MTLCTVSERSTFRFVGSRKVKETLQRTVAKKGQKEVSSVGFKDWFKAGVNCFTLPS